MDIYISFTPFYLLLTLAHECHAASWTNVSAEVKNVATIYEDTTSVIPLQDLSKTLNVLLRMQLLAINDFDDVAGIMDISTYLSMEWIEEIYFNAYGSTAPDTSVTISAASIWKPSLILVNSAGESSGIIQDQSQVRIYLKSGKCSWTENVVFKVSCRPNVYFYPFDVHDCSVKFTTRAYNSSELTLVASSFQKDHFDESVSWSVKKMSTETVSQDSKSHAIFKLTIARRPMNYILNYILPILILSGLNIFVFILPRKSGERAGYSVTCFLAFVVFMDTIVTSLPKSSAPVSVLVYYVTVMMAISAVITTIVVFTLIIDKNVTKEEEEEKKKEEEKQKEEEKKKKEEEEKKKEKDEKEGKVTQTDEEKQKKKKTKREKKKRKTKNRTCKKCSSYGLFCCCYVSNQIEDTSASNTQNESSDDDKLSCPPHRWPKRKNEDEITDDVSGPLWLQRVTWLLRFRCFMTSKLPIKFRWTQIGNSIDAFCFCFFLLGEIIFSVAYLTPVSQQYSAETLNLDLPT